MEARDILFRAFSIQFQCCPHFGFKVKVADTVGAGDSFLATLIYHLLYNSPPQKSIEMACAMGSLVAGKHGANAEVTEEEIQLMINSLKIEIIQIIFEFSPL